MRFDHADLDPRAKLVFAIAVTGIAIGIPTIRSLGLLAGIVVAVLGIGHGFGIRELVRSVAPLKVLIPIILVLNTFFYPSGTVLWSIDRTWFPLALTTGGLETSGVIAGRLLLLGGVAAWFAATTESEAFELALVKLGIPWSIAFMMSMSLRLVPEMRTRFHRIEETQRARGLTTAGGPITRARQRIPMLIPFLASVIRYGNELGDALTVRDFGHAERRTYSVALAFAPRDYLFSLLSGAMVVAFFITMRP